MKLRDGFKLEQNDDGIYIAEAVGERAKEYPHKIQMSPSAGYLWALLSDRDLTELELIRKLGGLFDTDVSDEQLISDVEVFLNFLREQNLLEE